MLDLLSTSKAASKPWTSLIAPFFVSGESLTLPNMVSNSAVATWLHFLQMDQYLTEFLDNGYDDLETAKKVSVIALVLVGPQFLILKELSW